MVGCVGSAGWDGIGRQGKLRGTPGTFQTQCSANERRALHDHARHAAQQTPSTHAGHLSKLVVVKHPGSMPSRRSPGLSPSPSLPSSTSSTGRAQRHRPRASVIDWSIRSTALLWSSSATWHAQGGRSSSCHRASLPIIPSRLPPSRLQGVLVGSLSRANRTKQKTIGEHEAMNTSRQSWDVCICHNTWPGEQEKSRPWSRSLDSLSSVWCCCGCCCSWCYYTIFVMFGTPPTRWLGYIDLA